MNKPFTIPSEVPNHPIIDKAYEDLNQAILSNAFKPGTQLSENQLDSSPEISRTPVRVVLRRLEQDGLVENIPRKGAFFSRIATTDVIEIYQIREALKGRLAARLPVERTPAHGLVLLRELYQRLERSKAAQTLESLDEAGWALSMNF